MKMPNDTNRERANENAKGLIMVDSLLEQVGKISALATICEVKMRVLADNNEVLAHLAHSKKLEDVENGIFKSFERNLTLEEVKKLKAGRVIRNKVLHGDFEAASIKLDEVEANKLSKPEGFALDLNTGEVRDIGSKPIKSSSIFEWLLAIGTSGFFPLAAGVLQTNISTIDRLLEQTSKKEITPGPL